MSKDSDEIHKYAVKGQLKAISYDNIDNMQKYLNQVKIREYKANMRLKKANSSSTTDSTKK